MLKINNIKYLVVHCSDTPDTDNLKASDIHKMHLSFGWEGIGYHKIINRSGVLENGRPEFWVGAHVYGYNEISLGVCLIGKNNFMPEQLGALFKLLTYWKGQYKNTEVVGHRDFPNTSKTCPNFDVKKWWSNKIKGLKN
ncbi:N-acetylmuramoyl-L-alanine amidase [Pseudomonadota bacterium]|nr:N-acetylmuramoyl-L-alanine amidase [Pseudomonadota bacterium]